MLSRFSCQTGIIRVALAVPLGLAACRAESYPLPASPAEESRPPPLVAVLQPPSSEHFYVQGSKLFDSCGEEVVLRGVSKMSVWTDPRGDDFSEIAKTSANSVRIVWTIQDHPGEEALESILARAVDEQLIPIIELHDATGVLDQVPELVQFWARPEIVDVLKQHERHLIVNIANEAGGSGVSKDRFVEVYQAAIRKLRAVGLNMPLMIDAPQWGQNIDLLQASASELLAADPQRNLLFSAHFWWPKNDQSNDPGSTQRIQRELEESAGMGLPLVVGEFAHAGVGCAESIDYHTILAEAQRLGIGWLAWSWGPGNQDCAAMDMTTNGKFDTLHGWGLEAAVRDPNSIRNTSKIPASIRTGQCADAQDTSPRSGSDADSLRRPPNRQTSARKRPSVPR